MKAFVFKIGFTLALALVMPFTAAANDELKSVNDIIEQKAQQLDRNHGLLMTATERDNYKIKVIAQKLADKQADNTNLTLNDLVNDGVVVYELTEHEERQLLIDLEPMTNGSGYEPPK